MNLSRDHHVVPQFHLKRFADAQRRVRQLSDDDRDGTLVPVKRATVRDGFYNILTRSGEEHDGWEKIFGLFETAGARVVADVVEHGVWPLPERRREQLANWLAAQYLRTPAFRRLLDQSLESWRCEVDRAGRAAIVATVTRPDLTDDEAVALWQRGDVLYPREEPQSSNTQLRWFQDLLWGTAKAFYERRWVLTRFEEPARPGLGPRRGLG